jgi:hypothetical protein
MATSRKFSVYQPDSPVCYQRTVTIVAFPGSYANITVSKEGKEEFGGTLESAALRQLGYACLEAAGEDAVRSVTPGPRSITLPAKTPSTFVVVDGMKIYWESEGKITLERMSGDEA